MTSRLLSRPASLSFILRRQMSVQKAMMGVSLDDLPKSHVFTSSLPPDPKFKNPLASHHASRDDLGPRIVKGALYTYVRPELSQSPELLCVSSRAIEDIGLRSDVANSPEFADLAAGNKIYWDEKSDDGIYPWAQCYGGWQFGSWAGQLGDGRAISLFESKNPNTQKRYEFQLKGAGKTPYSRFADGKAVLRSSIREFVVSEALNGLKIPTTRAAAITLLPKEQVRRERMEPGAIVARFAESWLRIGTYDLLRARGERGLIRQLSDYVAENVYAGWSSLPPVPFSQAASSQFQSGKDGVSRDTVTEAGEREENRYTRLYRAIIYRNARTVAAWQAYGFTNGVLNTDNTSILGLSLDFGPFAFLDNFDPKYTPNHDDHMLRYSYQNQPSIIWWNLVRLGESLGELIGAGSRVDDQTFVEKGVSEDLAPALIKRAETIIQNMADEFKAVFLDEYTRLMQLRLGLKTSAESDFKDLFSELLDTLEALELDFNNFFRRLSLVQLEDVESYEQRLQAAEIFFHAEDLSKAKAAPDDANRVRVAAWLHKWSQRCRQDWSNSDAADEERQSSMKRYNPKFTPRSWILDEIIKRVQEQGERQVLADVMKMVEKPFDDTWGVADEERWCGDVPRQKRGMQCSCSS